MAEICVLGLGYVGLPTASLLAHSGARVLGVDPNREIVEALREGRTRLREAGLAAMLSAAFRSGNLSGATRPEPSEAFLICVPTPIREDRRADLCAVQEAAEAIRPLLRPGNLVILESTSPVGTTRNLVGGILARSGLRAGRDFHLCYGPERVLPGRTLDELTRNERLIGGYTRTCAERARKLYARFCRGRITLTDDRTAELCKLMENTYRDVNIALANTFGHIAEAAGVDGWRAIEYANRHPRVDILQPGPGVGGHCIPVDPWFLISAYPEQSALLRGARERNDAQPRRMLERLKEAGPLRSGAKLALLGAAYKADLDDARESPAFSLAAQARAEGFEVALHDPLVAPGMRRGQRISGDLDACLRGADAAVLLTPHRFYRALSPRPFLRRMRGRLLLDARHWLNRRLFRRAGFRVLVLGVAPEAETWEEQEPSLRALHTDEAQVQARRAVS